MFFQGISDPPFARVGAEEGAAAENGIVPDHQQPSVSAVDAAMAYQPYPQQYYYPDRYGYPAYMDMSPQVMQYDMYPPADHHAQQPMIYY